MMLIRTLFKNLQTNLFDQNMLPQLEPSRSIALNVVKKMRVDQIMMKMGILDPSLFMQHPQGNLRVRIDDLLFPKVFGNQCHVRIKLHGIKFQMTRNKRQCCIQKSRYVSSTTANSRINIHQGNMSKIYPVIATHDNEPSSQLEAEIGDNEEEDDNFDITRLINQATQHIKHGDIFHVLSTPAAIKQGKCKAKHITNLHEVVYHASSGRQSARQTLSLVDCGADGGIAGDNVHIIATTDRSVNVTGININ